MFIILDKDVYVKEKYKLQTGQQQLSLRYNSFWLFKKIFACIFQVLSSDHTLFSQSEWGKHKVGLNAAFSVIFPTHYGWQFSLLFVCILCKICMVYFLYYSYLCPSFLEFDLLEGKEHSMLNCLQHVIKCLAHRMYHKLFIE